MICLMEIEILNLLSLKLKLCMIFNDSREILLEISGGKILNILKINLVKSSVSQYISNKA